MTAATTAESWRDYAEQLTAEQIADLESWDGIPEKTRLGFAQRRVAHNRGAELFRDVPAPPNCDTIFGADPDDDGASYTMADDGSVLREIVPQLAAEHAAIHLSGYQRADGSVARWDLETGELAQFDPAGLTRYLRALADELDAITRG